MKKDDLVSVIMPLFNSEKFMESAINSVLDQDYVNLELLIVDDCSSDDSLKIGRALAAKDKRVHIIASLKNGGSAVSRNIAINLAKGRYISFLDSDDLWLPNKLSTQLEFMRNNQVAFSFSDYQIINEESKITGVRRCPPTASYRTLLSGNIIGCLTAVYDRKLIGTYEMPDIRMRQDFGLWLRILRDVDFAYNCQECLAQYRIYGKSLSSNKFKAAKFTWKLYRDHENIPFMRRAYIFTKYAIKAILQRM